MNTANAMLPRMVPKPISTLATTSVSFNTPTSKANNITTGRIYQNVINREREGAFLGKTVQVVPHITDEIKRNIRILAKAAV